MNNSFRSPTCWWCLPERSWLSRLKLCIRCTQLHHGKRTWRMAEMGFRVEGSGHGGLGEVTLAIACGKKQQT